MANAFEIGHQRTQTRSDKTCPDHRFIDWGKMRFLTVSAIASHAAVLADLDRTRDDLDLLDDPRQFVAHLNVTAAIRASRPGILPRLVDLIERKRGSLVTRVSRLCSLLALTFSLGGRLWRLDDIAGRWLGRGGRILLRTSELGFKLFLARGELGDLLLELSTLWAAARLGIVHDENKLSVDAKSAKSNRRCRERLPIHDLGSLAYTDPNYTLVNAPLVRGKLTIQTVPLTISANSLTRVYGSANPLLTYTITGFVNGETASSPDLTGTPSVSTVATATSPVGSYPITIKVGKLWSPNYTFTFESGTLIVAPAVLTVTAGNATRAYGAVNPTLNCNITGFVNNQTEATSDLTGTPGVSSAATLASSVGPYAITPSMGTLKSNDYTFVFQAGTLTVTPAALTVAAVNASRAYGVANPTLTYTINGFVNGETATTGGVTGTPALSTPADASSSVGVYPITVGLGTLSANNYTLQSSGPGTLTITPALLIVHAQNLQRSYDISNPSFAYLLVLEDQPQTAVSAAESESSGAPTLSTQADIDSAVGTYPITPTLGTLTIANPNYVLNVPNFQPGTLTITPATLTITANADSRVYGAADPTFTDTISGFIGGQTLATSGVTGAPAFTTTSSTTSGVGNSYEIIPNVGSLKSTDYRFSFMPGTLTITPAPLTIKANNISQSFGTKQSLSVSYIGLVNGDTVASLMTKPVLFTTATENSLPGAYPIAVSGASSTNYTITYKNGTYTVMQSTTTAALEGPLLRSTVASPVTFTVDVSSFSLSSVPLTGLVLFYDQAQVIGEAPVVNGVATLTTSGLAKGNYMIYAIYQGDNNFQTSTTGTIVQMIMSTATATPVKPTAPVPAHRKVAAKPKSKPQPKPRAMAPKPEAHRIAVKQSRALSR